MLSLKEAFFSKVLVHNLGVKVCDPGLVWVKEQVLFVLSLWTISISDGPYLKSTVSVGVALSLHTSLGFRYYV